MATAANPYATTAAPSYLGDATRDSIIQQAKTKAATSGLSAEQELYNYASGQGLDAASIDTMMGFGAGSTQTWMNNTFKPAPQGNSYTPPAASTPKLVTAPAAMATAPTAPVAAGATAAAPAAYLGDATRDAILQQAQAKAKASGWSPEYELYQYGKSQGLVNSAIDTMMGFQPGATDSWEKGSMGSATATPAPAGAATNPNVQELYAQMQRMFANGDEAGARALYSANQKAYGFTDAQFAPYATTDGGTFTPEQIAQWKVQGQSAGPVDTSGVTRAALTQWNVAPNQTVRQQVADLIDQDGPLMQQARSNAEQQMNARGLINSSMGIGAGQASVLNKAVEIGTQDANTYASAAQANAAAGNVNAQFNAGATNTWNTQAQDRTQQTTIAQLQINATKELAGIESQYKNLTQASSSATSIVNGYSTNVQRILENDALDAPAKQAAIDMQRTNTQNALKLIGALGGDVDLSTFLDEVLG